MKCCEACGQRIPWTPEDGKWAGWDDEQSWARGVNPGHVSAALALLDKAETVARVVGCDKRAALALVYPAIYQPSDDPWKPYADEVIRQAAVGKWGPEGDVPS